MNDAQGGYKRMAYDNSKGYFTYLNVPRMLCNGNGAISHLQTEMGFVEDFRYSLDN